MKLTYKSLLHILKAIMAPLFGIKFKQPWSYARPTARIKSGFRKILYMFPYASIAEISTPLSTKITM